MIEGTAVLGDVGARTEVRWSALLDIQHGPRLAVLGLKSDTGLYPCSSNPGKGVKQLTDCTIVGCQDHLVRQKVEYPPWIE